MNSFSTRRQEPSPSRNPSHPSPRRRRSPVAIMAGLAPRCEGKTNGGEGNSGLLRSPFAPLSPLYPRSIYLFKHFGMDNIRAIRNCADGKTFEQKIDRLREELRAFERAGQLYHEDEDEDEDEDEGEGEDETDEKIGKLLGDEKKHGIVKRPQAPIEGELECKKPRIAEGSRCQGEEPEAGGTMNSSRV